MTRNGWSNKAQSNAKIMEIENSFNIITPCYKKNKNNQHHAELQIRL